MRAPSEADARADAQPHISAPAAYRMPLITRCTGARAEVRNQAIRGDFTKYGMLQQYRTGLDSELVRSIVQTAVSSALKAHSATRTTTVATTATTCPNMG